MEERAQRVHGRASILSRVLRYAACFCLSRNFLTILEGYTNLDITRPNREPTSVRLTHIAGGNPRATYLRAKVRVHYTHRVGVCCKARVAGFYGADNPVETKRPF